MNVVKKKVETECTVWGVVAELRDYEALKSRDCAGIGVGGGYDILRRLLKGRLGAQAMNGAQRQGRKKGRTTYQNALSQNPPDDKKTNSPSNLTNISRAQARRQMVTQDDRQVGSSQAHFQSPPRTDKCTIQEETRRRGGGNAKIVCVCSRGSGKKGKYT